MQVVLPKLGLTMTHGTITEWLKAPGDVVAPEEPLCTYETEKVTLELTSPEAGVLSEILVPAGEQVPVGTPVCVVTTPADDRPSERTARAKDGVSEPGAAAAGLATDSPTPSGERFEATPRARALARERGMDLRAVRGRGPGGRIHAADILALEPAAERQIAAEVSETASATPLARRVAEANALDLRAVVGSGPDGLIMREDVERALQRVERVAAEAQALPSTDRVVPLTGIRKVIGDRMSQSAFSAPHVTLMTEAEATNLVSARAQLNEELATGGSPIVNGHPGLKISFNAILAALVARALREHPYLNARLEADGIHLASEVNLALAVDSDRGLLTPVLHDVNQLSLAEIQRGYDALIQRAMSGTSLPEDSDGGTFTITNLGSLDVDGFTPVINPPQSGILGIGRIVEKPVARDGATVIRAMVTLSLSFDHRVVDGAPAARFLQRIKHLVERPMALLIGGRTDALPSGSS
jgi:pyruvate dehydrogenase E2 component (dihydrolipoamide acetyltransferase)